MKKLAILLLFAMPMVIFGQEKMFVQTKNVVVGKNIKDNSAIRADEYLFPFMVEDYKINTEKHCMFGKTKAEKDNSTSNQVCQIFKYDFLEKKIVWNTAINVTENVIDFNPSSINISNEKSSCKLNLETGKMETEFYGSIAISCPKENIEIGYDLEFKSIADSIYNSKKIKRNYFDFEEFNNLKPLKKSKLVGVDRLTKKIIWKRELEQGFGWNDVRLIDDSIAIILSEGLFSLNIFTGKGWDYKGKTSIVDKVFGVITYRLCSNILIDNNSYTFADKDNISRLDSNGKELWYNPLIQKSTGKSLIFDLDSTLLLVNLGYAKMNYNYVGYGFPYLYLVDKKGENIRINYLNNEKLPIKDYLFADTCIYILQDNKISKFSVLSLEKLAEAKLNVKKGEILFIKNESGKYRKSNTDLSFVEPVKFDHIIIKTKNSDTIYLDKNLNQILDSAVINNLQVVQYFKFSLNNSLHYLTNKNETLFADGNNKIIADIIKITNVKLIENTWYGFHNNNLYSIPLFQIHP
jgi:hypothetical protein